MIVGGSHRRHIAGAGFPGVDEVRASPCEGGSSKLSDQQVPGKAGQAAIAVRIGMDRDQPVTEAHRDLVRWIGLVLDPISCVVDELAQIRCNAERVDSDVARGGSMAAGPFPDVPEHAAMKLVEKIDVQHSALSRSGPPHGRADIDLLRLIQFATQTDVRRDQLLALLRRQRRIGFIVVLEQRIVHDDQSCSHKRRSEPARKRSIVRRCSSFRSVSSKAWFSSRIV